MSDSEDYDGPNMCVHVVVNGMAPFSLHVGDGSQTIKYVEYFQSTGWLSCVAARRYALSVPHGRQRHREAAHVTGGSLVPLRVDTASTAKLAESIIKPTDHIGKVVRDGETVFVSLHSARELDSVGAVSMSSFELDAFQKGRHAEAVKKMRSAEASHHRRITSLMQRLRDGARGVHANAKMEETMGVGNPSDRTKTLDAMFAADWATLRMPRRCETQADRNEVEVVLHQRYEQIREVFRWYSNSVQSSTSDNADSFNMNALEFDSFIRDCHIRRLYEMGIFPTTIHANVLKTYKEDGAVSSSTGPGVMFRAQFVDALCTVACHIATERTTLTKSEKLTALMVESFLETYIAPRYARLTLSTTVRAMLVKEDVALFIHRESELITRVFEHFCDVRPTEASGGKPQMTQSAFITLLKATAILSEGAAVDEAIDSSVGSRRRVSVVDKDKAARPTSGAAGRRVGKLTPLGSSSALSTPASTSRTPFARDSSVSSKTLLGSEGVPVLVRSDTVTPARTSDDWIQDAVPLKMRDALMAFLLAQSEDEAAELIASTTDGVDTSRRAVSEMCFAEFLEAMARIALVVYPMPSVSLKAKLAVLVDNFAVFSHFRFKADAAVALRLYVKGQASAAPLSGTAGAPGPGPASAVTTSAAATESPSSAAASPASDE